MRVHLLSFHAILGVLLTILLNITPTFLYAQISQGGMPYSLDASLDKQIERIVLPNVDVNTLRAEDVRERNAATPVPPRFGFAHDVSLNIMEHGTWTDLNNGDRVWRLKLHSPNAYSINLIFDKFYLPPGATFFIYNKDKTNVLGAFTDFNNKEHEKFSTSPTSGDVTILEYYEPKGAKGKVKLSISKVVHAYQNMFGERSDSKGHYQKSGYGSSGSCNINVNCSQGSPWQDQKRGVAMVILGDGTRWCSGSLLNNIREDATPYFLTANHCLTGNVETWLFMFNYESSGCSNSNGPTHQTVSGATLRANHANTDFALLELSNKPPKSYETSFLGWSAVNTVANSTATIHHPSGDIKKISFDNDSPTIANYLQTSGTTHWRIGSWNSGTTEPGSSGAPLFDHNQRVIGQLHGGYAACGNSSSDWYGRFDLSWNGGGTNSTRLRNWLDPDNTGTLTLNGMDDPYPHAPFNLVLNPIGTHPKLAWQPSASSNVANYNIYRNVYPTSPSWQVLISTGSTTYDDTDINIGPFGSGSIDVFYRVTAVNNANLESLPSNVRFTQGDWNMLAKINDAEESKQEIPSVFQLEQNYPNPFNPATEIRFNLPESVQVQLSIFDITGRKVARLVEETMEAGSHQVSWNAGNLSSGVYIMHFRAGNFIQSRSMVLLK